MSATLGHLKNQSVVVNIYCKTCDRNKDIDLDTWIEKYGSDQEIDQLLPKLTCTRCQGERNDPKNCGYRKYPIEVMNFPDLTGVY